MIEAIAAGTRLRRDRRLVTRTQAEEGSCDFGKGERPTVQVSWGDVSTAFHSTGIPNIEVQFEALPAIRRMTQTPAFIKSFLGLGFMQSCLRAQVGCMPCKKRSGLSGPMGISSKLIICALPKGSFSSIS